MSKHQLTISPSYVQDWTYVEAIREIFQNALDNQVTEPENTMYFNYDEPTQTLTIGNKTSVLEVNSLLMGYSSKRDDAETIGRHGEGYKVALMVLLREGKEILISNYGKKEVWETRFINSRKFKGERITEITVKSNFIFKSPPHNDLEFIIKGITAEEYAVLVEKNLNLQTREEDVDYISTSQGELLLTEEEKGNLYVSGLFITNEPSISKGYNFRPHIIELDRDRKLVGDFKLRWEVAKLLQEIEDHPIVIDLLLEDSKDAEFYSSTRGYRKTEAQDRVDTKILQRFKEEHGEDSIPVHNNEQLRIVQRTGVGTPVLVSKSVSELLETHYAERKVVLKSPRDMFNEWITEVEHKLSDEEVEDFKILVDKYVK